MPTHLNSSSFANVCVRNRRRSALEAEAGRTTRRRSMSTSRPAIWSVATDLLAAATDAGSGGSARRRPPASASNRSSADREAAEARVRDREAKLADAEALLRTGRPARLAAAAQARAESGCARPARDPARRASRSGDQAAEAEEAAEKRRTGGRRVWSQAATQRVSGAEPKAGDLALAVKEIEQALALEPDHAGALALQATADAAIAAEQQAAVIRASIRNARNRFANGKHQAAFQLLEKLDPVVPSDCRGDAAGIARGAPRDRRAAPHRAGARGKTPPARDPDRHRSRRHSRPSVSPMRSKLWRRPDRSTRRRRSGGIDRAGATRPGRRAHGRITRRR